MSAGASTIPSNNSALFSNTSKVVGHGKLYGTGASADNRIMRITVVPAYNAAVSVCIILPRMDADSIGHSAVTDGALPMK